MRPDSEKYKAENMMQNRTSSNCASPFNYSKADTIIVMKKENCRAGVDELIALNGMYNKLVTQQSLNNEYYFLIQILQEIFLNIKNVS
jgi:hypothetical protein